MIEYIVNKILSKIEKKIYKIIAQKIQENITSYNYILSSCRNHHENIDNKMKTITFLADKIISIDQRIDHKLYEINRKISAYELVKKEVREAGHERINV
jgi:hypothetical protein